MLNKIIHFSLQNRILVLVASVLLLIGGTYTAMHTEVDAVSYTHLTVMGFTNTSDAPACMAFSRSELKA